MASLSLPPPRKTPVQAPRLAPEPAEAVEEGSAGRKKESLQTKEENKTTTAPSYEERCRAAAQVSRMTPQERQHTGTKLFVPRSLQDFDDGGAFPEIHVAQYPRHMGNPHLKRKQAPASNLNTTSSSSAAAAASSSRVVTVKSVQIDKDGQVSYDSIVKGGTNQDKLVYSRHDDLRGGPATDVALPTADEQAAETARTAAALQALLSRQTALDKPSGSALAHVQASANIEEKTQYIQYKPNPAAPGYNPAAAQRVIQMVPAQVDPMMPPKHKHLKAPPGPAEDPVPVLHAPPTKLTKEEKDAWNIPSCISNWKNMRGYTIPLDKRLAADGRGLREHAINANFATLSESLYVAERQARQEVRMRATVQKQLALQEKDQREAELRDLAQQARLQRGGGVAVSSLTTTAAQQPSVSDHDSDDDDDVESITKPPDNSDKPETEDQVAARQREIMRRERKRERERELRLESNVELKKKKRLEEERDVSEQIALGVHTGTGGDGVAGNVDSRLYNQTGGMDSGFGADDEYNAYSKPLFDRGAASSSIYRPTRGETAYNADEQYDKLKQGATSRFQPDKGFAGAQGGMDVSAGARTAPVQFEKGQSK